MKFSTAFWLRTAPSSLKHFRDRVRHFSYAGTAFWLRFSGILVTLGLTMCRRITAIRAAPVVTCIKPCRKPPVVGRRKLWKSLIQVITGSAASQRERAYEQSSVAKYRATARDAGNRAITTSLVTLAALALPALALLSAAYIQSRPNTFGIAVTGPFDGERAFTDLRTLVSFGPRPSGSPALGRAREFITAELRAAGVGVTEDRFVAKTPIGPIPMKNIVAEIPGASPSIVIVGGHYDTKRMDAPFVGANDGGSSAAFLLEMARVLARRTNKLTYWLVFFDGEEAVNRWSATDSLYGSRHFAAELAAQGIENRIRVVTIVDMIADAHLDIHREAQSTPWLSDLLFAQAKRLGYDRHFLNRPKTVEDDHLPFLKLGIPAVDIIDLDYGPFNLYWHAQFDTLDRCSGTSLAIIGAVLLQALHTIEQLDLG